MENLFTNEVINFISNEMKIDINHLTEKIISDIPKINHKFFNDLFECMKNIKITGEDKEDYINNKLYSLFTENGFNENEKEYIIFDTIRHAFIDFMEGGVLNMYLHIEAEDWYPKIIIDSFLGNKKDIDELEKNIKIYRGSSMDEYISKKFGQSWSLSKNIARKFAFTYYANQENYRNQERIIMETIIPKEIIFFYDKSNNEQEIIIDNLKLNSYKVKIVE
jgi:hypothetical protein